MILPYRASLALVLVATGGCSGSSSPRVAADARDGANSAAVVNRAVEPRTGDPTAARPPPARLDAPPAAPGGTSIAPAGTAPPAAKTVPAEAPKIIGARHVLIQWIGAQKAGPSVLRSREQALAIAEEVLKKAKAGGNLGRLAVDYSDEPNAGTRAGSLGRFGRGAMVPAFEQAAWRLEVGEVSDIVETPFGFHIIQRTE